MDSSHWQIVQQTFAAAVDLPPESLDAYLAGACAGRPELRTEVESLLAAHRRAGAFMEPVPDVVGPYRLIAEIGRGGMGAVYRAERHDGQFEQQVAVKLWSVAGSATLYRRFLDECQILARLSQPNIARLLDGGVTPSGLPYIVMEYVDGVPIDEFCRGRTVAERLRLFREICAAVHYAHQNLVVHRDLKPANILVTTGGAPKLLDFGIAKILTPAERPAGVTLIPAMTPEYASPEQIRGGHISIMSDIYSLGLLLHELLTGRRLYDLTGKNFDEIIHIVCDDPRHRPQTGSADLDAIIAKAVRTDPAERYSSAEGLALDVRRYQSKRPVEARRGALWYVFSTFLARNRLAVAIALAVAILLAASAAITVRQSQAANRRFNDVRQLAHAVVFEIHDAVAALPASTAARRLIVANALQYLDRLARDAGDDRGLQVELAKAYLKLGDVLGLQSQANLGDPNGAIASFRKARLLFDGALRAGPGDRDAVLGLALTCRHMALVLAFLRQGEEARQAARQAVTLMESLVQREPTDTNRRSLAGAYSNLGDVDGSNLDVRYKALAISEELLAAKPADPGRQRDVALVHKYIAAVLVENPDERAAPHLRRAEEIDTARVAAMPNDAEAQLDLSFDYSQNGSYHQQRNRLPEALANYRKALAIRQRLAHADPADARLQDRVVYASGRVGNVLMRMKNPREALLAYKEALRASQFLQTLDARHPQYRSNLAMSLRGVGGAESAAGNKRQACAAWGSASAVYNLMDRDGQLRPSERQAVAELRRQVAGCGH
ncbi:MAG: tetratricopeptide repeat protein [Acidobacteria bacterium]|nr:tetratricopeptide repeat protein [Acidobacteriota bacterium]